MFSRALALVTRICNHAGTLLIVVAMLLVTLDVIGRALGSPVRGVPEMVGTAIVAIVFLQVPHALAAGRMIRSDALLQWVARRGPGAAFAIEGVFALVGAVFFGLIIVAAVPLVNEAWKAGTFLGVSGYFTMPVWPVKVVLVAGCVLAAIQYLVLAFERFARVRSGEPWRVDGGVS